MIRHTKIHAEFVLEANSANRKKKKTKDPAVAPVINEEPNKPAEEEPLFFGPKDY